MLTVKPNPYYIKWSFRCTASTNSTNTTNASLAYLHRRYIGPHVFPRMVFSGMLLLHEPFGIPGTRRLEKQSSAQLGKSAAAVPREGELTLVPRVQGITFNPPSRSFLWEESVHREEFRFRAGAVLEGSTEYQFMGCHDCVVEALAEIAREQVLLAGCMREEAAVWMTVVKPTQAMERMQGEMFPEVA